MSVKKLLDENTLTAIKDYATSNYVTLSTNQTISGVKTFTNNILIDSSKKITFNASENPASIGWSDGGYITVTNLRAGNYVLPMIGSGYGNIGISTIRWGNYYGVDGNFSGNLTLSGNLTDGTNSITVEEIVNKQDAIQVKRYI